MTPSPKQIEAVARAIAPRSWEVMDGYLAALLRKYKGENAGYDPEAFKDKKSMMLATAALTAFLQSLSDEGWVVVPKEPSIAMLCAAQKAIGQYRDRFKRMPHVGVTGGMKKRQAPGWFSADEKHAIRYRAMISEASKDQA